jgi:hypothetical protein
VVIGPPSYYGRHGTIFRSTTKGAEKAPLNNPEEVGARAVYKYSRSMSTCLCDQFVDLIDGSEAATSGDELPLAQHT